MCTCVCVSVCVCVPCAHCRLPALCAPRTVAVGLASGFPHVLPGSVRADDATVQLQVVSAVEARVLCGGAPTGSTAPTSANIKDGVLADGVTPAPLVWLSASFRPARVSESIFPAGHAGLIGARMWLGVYEGLRELDVFCTAGPVNPGEGPLSTPAEVAATRLEVRFLSSLRRDTFTMTLQDIQGNSTGAAPVAVVPDATTGQPVVQLETGPLSNRLLMIRDMHAKAFEVLTASVTLNITG
jgi:hypothetical protein